MIDVSIVTNNSHPNSRAFNCPILASRNYSRDMGLKLHFHYSPSSAALSGDVLLINSNVFRSYWQTKKKGEIFRFLESAAKAKMKIIWFDTTDSTWCTQFEVLPYVHKFMKSQIFADKQTYLHKFRTGRIFTDFFDGIYHSGETETDYFIPQAQELAKVGISWNTCFENYDESRYGLKARLKQKLRPLTSALFQSKLEILFTTTNIYSRPFDISCRVGLSHSRPSVIAHRKAIMKSLERYKVDCRKVPLEYYFDELRNCKIGMGPFGVGEITLRDYEIIICGATLVKPDLRHMSTWPELFIPGLTYVPHAWDLSDLDDRIEMLLEDNLMADMIASKAQEIYYGAVSDEGMHLFASRLAKMILTEKVEL